MQRLGFLYLLGAVVAVQNCLRGRDAALPGSPLPRAAGGEGRGFVAPIPLGSPGDGDGGPPRM